MGNAILEAIVLALPGLAVLVVISYLVGRDANRRGRSGAGWATLCFISALLAVPIYFLIISKTEGEHRNE